MADLTVLSNPKLLKKIQDTVFRGGAALEFTLTNNPGEWSSTAVEKPINYRNSNQGGAFSGLMQFDTTKVDTTVKMRYEPRWEYQPIVIDQTEVDRNQNDNTAAANIMKFSVQRACVEMAERLSSRIYGLGGTDTNGATIFEGFRALIDDGTEAATIGGLTRTAGNYTTLQSPFLDNNATLNASTLPTIGTYFGRATVGQDAPNIMFTTKDIFALYEQLITLTQFTNAMPVQKGRATRLGMTTDATSSLGINTGYDAIFYRGRPIVADEACPAYYFFGVNTNEMKWYGLQSKEDGATPITMGQGTEMDGYWKGMNSKNIGMAMRKFMHSSNQYGSVAQIIFGGSLTTFDPRKHFKLIFN